MSIILGLDILWISSTCCGLFTHGKTNLTIIGMVAQEHKRIMLRWGTWLLLILFIIQTGAWVSGVSPPKPGYDVTSITYGEGLMTLSGQGQRIDLR